MNAEKREYIAEVKKNAEKLLLNNVGLILGDCGYLSSSKTPACKGYFYTYRENVYMGKRGEIVSKTSFTPLKRASCPGCEQCGGIPEMLQLDIAEGYTPPPPKAVRDGDVLELVAVKGGRGPEDLYDEWHLEFKKKI